MRNCETQENECQKAEEVDRLSNCEHKCLNGKVVRHRGTAQAFSVTDE